MDIQDGIKSFRKRKGYSLQADLAEAAECSVATISSIERGERKPSYELSVKLLELGATVEELFGVPCNCNKVEAKAEEPAPRPSQQDAFREVFQRLEALEKERAKWAGYEPDKRSRGAG